MSLKQYKNSEDILTSKTSIEGFRWKPTDFSILNTEKALAIGDDPSDQLFDYAVEMHVYTPDGTWVAGDHRLSSAKITETAEEKPQLEIDIASELEGIGIERGSYKLAFNFSKNLLGNTENRSVFIKEISPDRKEVWLSIADSLKTNVIPDDNINITLGTQFYRFRRFVNLRYAKKVGHNNIVLNLGNNNIFKVVNARIGGFTVAEEVGETNLYTGTNIYLRLYEELPTEIVEKQRGWIAQEDKRPYIESINIYPKVEEEKFNTIKGPNFEIDHGYAMKTETEFKTWNELLDTTTATSQQIIDRYFSGSLEGINLNIDYSTFDNFVNYGSAEERLKNFRYKLQLVEYYDEQIKVLNAATGADASSLQGNVSINQKRKDEVISGFDGFEKWAYYQPTASLFTHGVSGSTVYAEDYCIKPFPKFLSGSSYYNYHTTSSLGAAWLNGLIASASLYDLENDNSLINTIPENIQRNENNDQYVLFVNMIGHHFDILYSYIRELTRFHRTEEHPKLGIPGELLYDTAKSMGWQLSNGNQAEALWQYTVGKNVSGSYQSTGSLFSKSSEDITHEVWRRIVNNMPYLLKTKGTKRSIYALMNTYGIPQTLLSIREYGGPKAPEQEPDLIEDRFNYALKFNPGARVVWNNSFLSSSLDGTISPIQTHEFRFKPGTTSSMLLMTNVRDSDGAWKSQTDLTGTPNGSPVWHLAVQHTASYSGSDKYGRLHFAIGVQSGEGGSSASMTEWLPIYDGNFWNVSLGWSTTGTHNNMSNNTDTTYTARIQHASDYITGKVVHSGSLSITPTVNTHWRRWSLHTPTDYRSWLVLGGITGSVDQLQTNKILTQSFGAPDASASILGGEAITLSDSGSYHVAFPGFFSGSIQEYRGWTEEIDDETFDAHTLNPTSYKSTLSPTASFHTLVRHYPFGTDLNAIDHSAGAGLIITSSHPNNTIKSYTAPSGSTESGSNTYASASGFITPTNTERGNYEPLTETYYIQAPSVGGLNTNSEKIRIEDSKLLGMLDPSTMAERSRYDYATLDSNKLGLFYSVADQINKDIYNQFNGISLDQFIGDPTSSFEYSYQKLQTISFEYWKKYSNRNDINAFIRIFSLFDFSLFTQIKQLIPARADSAMGVLVEPHVLERAKQKSVTVGKEEPNYEQRIQVPMPITSSILPLTQSIPPPYQITSSTLPLTQSIQYTRPVTGSYLTLTQSISGLTGSVTSHVSGSLTASFKSDIFDDIFDVSGSVPFFTNELSSYQAVLATDLSVSTQSAFTPIDQDPKTQTFRRIVGGKEYTSSLQTVYGPVVITEYYKDRTKNTGSEATSVDYDRYYTQAAPLQTIIFDQHASPSNGYKRKEFFYGAKDLAVRYYPLDEFPADSMMRDKSPFAKNAISYSIVANDSNDYVAQLGSSADFESFTHQYLESQMLLFHCPTSSLSGTTTRGGDSITIPTFPNSYLENPNTNNQKPWSISWLQKECSGSTNHGMNSFGFRSTTSFLGFGFQNIPFVRDVAAEFWAPNTGSNELHPSGSVDGHYFPEKTPLPTFYNTANGGTGSNYLGGMVQMGGVSASGQINRESLNHICVTYQPSVFNVFANQFESGSMRWWFNGELIGGVDKGIMSYGSTAGEKALNTSFDDQTILGHGNSQSANPINQQIGGEIPGWTTRGYSSSMRAGKTIAGKVKLVAGVTPGFGLTNESPSGSAMSALQTTNNEFVRGKTYTVKINVDSFTRVVACNYNPSFNINLVSPYPRFVKTSDPAYKLELTASQTVLNAGGALDYHVTFVNNGGGTDEHYKNIQLYIWDDHSTNSGYTPVGNDTTIVLNSCNIEEVTPTGDVNTGSFRFTEIGVAYQNSAKQHNSFSGSIGQVQMFEHALNYQEVAYLYRFPHKKANRSHDGAEIFTRKNSGVAAREIKFQDVLDKKAGKTTNTTFKQTTDYPGLPTSESLVDVDFDPDAKLSVGMKRLFYEGCKLTAPDFNVAVKETTDGGPVVSFSTTNANTLRTKEGNLRIN